jgi:hypothetical protein
MNKLNLNIPIYDVAEFNLISSVLDNIVKSHPIIGQIPVIPTHHRGLTRVVDGDVVIDQPPFLLTQLLGIDKDIIRNSKIEEYANVIRVKGNSFKDSTARKFYETIDSITKTTGNVFDFNNGLGVFDAINTFLEANEMVFDSEGNPILHKFFVEDPALNEKLQQLQPSMEQEEKFRSIIERKRNEFYTQKRTRRLS